MAKSKQQTDESIAGRGQERKQSANVTGPGETSVPRHDHLPDNMQDDDYSADRFGADGGDNDTAQAVDQAVDPSIDGPIIDKEH